MIIIVHPKYRGKTLTITEYKTGIVLLLLQKNILKILPDLVNFNFKAVASPFQRFMFLEKVIQTVQPVDWWKSQVNHLHKDTTTAVNQLLTATASSAGLESFSSFSLVHSDFHSQLEI